MAIGQGILPAGQADHIQINLGNVFTIGLLSILFVGAAQWTSQLLARTDIPVVSHLAIGAQYYLHAA